MAPPMWLEECSCGALTGNLSISATAPAPSMPRLGHEGHEPRYVKLAEDSSALTAAQRARRRQADAAFVAAARNPSPRLTTPNKRSKA